MSDNELPEKKPPVTRGSAEDDAAMECDGDSENENITKDIMDGKRSSPRRKDLRDPNSSSTDKRGRGKSLDGSSEEAETEDEVKSKPSKSEDEDEEFVPEPPTKRRKIVRSEVQENVSGEETSEGKKSKPPKGKKRKRRAPKRLTLKKRSKSKKKAKVEQDEEEYEVEKIVKVKLLRDGKKEFLIRWKGYAEEYDSWEPEENLTCKDLVNQYFEKHKEIIEFAVEEEEEKKPKKAKKRRSGSSRARKPKKTADAEEGANKNAKKRKGSSKQSRSKSKKKKTQARKSGAKKGKNETAATDSEKAKKGEDDENSQNAGGSPDAEDKGKHSSASDSEDQTEYDVEKIVDVRTSKEGHREFLIKWRGYASKYNSWEAEYDMNCSEKIEQFLRAMEQNTERQLRGARKKTALFAADGGRRKLSSRLERMPRKSYSEID